MLTNGERETLVSYVHDQMSINPGPATVERFVGPDITDELPGTFTFLIHVAEWIVNEAEKHTTADILINVINQVDDGSAGIAPLVNIATRLSDGTLVWKSLAVATNVNWEIGSDPTEVKTGKPFVDRMSFRKLLPRLGVATDTPICTVIAGADGSGKTYLHEYCAQFASRGNDLRVGFTKVGGSGVSSLSPHSLAIELAGDLRTDFSKIPRRHEDAHRYARNLVAWLVQFTPARALPALAIFDGFDHDDVPPAVHTFILEFLLALQNNTEANEKLRAVLLGYDTGRLEEKSISFQVCVLEHIGTGEISTWFRRRFPGRLPYQYEDTAALIHRDLPNGEQRMRTLCNMIYASQVVFTG